MAKYKRPLVLVGTRSDMEPYKEIAEELGIPIMGILDRFYVGQTFEGLEVLGSDLDLINQESWVYKTRDFADYFVSSFFGGRTNTDVDSQNTFQLRMERMELVERAGVNLINLIHPGAQVSASANIGRNTLILYGAYIESHVRIGSFGQFMYRSSVAHHSTIGRNCTILPDGGTSGSVTVGDNVIIGVNSRILSAGDEESRIGNNVLIGPGVTVLKDIPDNSIVQVNGKILPNERFTSDVYGGIGISPSYKRLSS